LKFAERKLTPQQLADGIDEYFRVCETTEKKPTKPGLCTYLGISTSTWDNWMREGAGKAVRRDLKGAQGNRDKGEGRFAEYIWPMKRAMQMISDGLEQRTDTMAMFLLKQQHYGGYSDKGEQTAGGNMAITIRFGETHKNTAMNYGK
jgi:hypothetical protein